MRAVGLRVLSLLELAPPVLARALDPFPSPVRTLDALHLASLDFLVALGQRPSLATYDHRLASAATAMGVPTIDPDRAAEAAPAGDQGRRRQGGSPRSE